MMRRFITLLAISSLACFALGQAKADGPFVDLDFDKACAKAKAENKVVFIDFYTSWCVPCKKLDKTTWVDADVVKFLNERAVSLKLDAEKTGRVVATKYKISMYPTMLFLKPDGTEIDRIVGYRDAKEFLSEGGDALSGKDAVTRAREKWLATGENDPTARMRFADVLSEREQYPEALEHYLWCFDKGGAANAMFIGVRNSFLLGKIKAMAKNHPVALTALKERRDAAAKRVLGDNPSPADGQDLAAINRVLGEGAATLTVYGQLKEKGAAADAVRRVMFDEVREPLIQAKRYADVVEGIGDVSTAIKRATALYEMKTQSTKNDREIGPKIQESALNFMIDELADFYEAYIGDKKPDDAAQIVAAIEKASPSGTTFAGLIKRAVRAGDAAAARAVADRGLKSLPPAQHEFINEAAAKIK